MDFKYIADGDYLVSNGKEEIGWVSRCDPGKWEFCPNVEEKWDDVSIFPVLTEEMREIVAFMEKLERNEKI